MPRCGPQPKKKECEEEMCFTETCFNYPGETIGRFCKQHILTGMIDIKNKRCAEPNCNARSYFNYANESIPRFCGEHKKPGMVDVVHINRCAEPNCNTHPSYNYANESTPRFCGEHKKPGMVDVRNKRCAEPNCSTRPSFNYANESIARFCGEHKEPGMVDVRHKRCAESNCNTRPYYNYPGQSAAYCRQHKTEQMIDVVTRRCDHTGCTQRPLFNFVGQLRGLFCESHKRDGMVKIAKKRNRPSNPATEPQDHNMMLGSPGQGMSGLVSPPNLQPMGPHRANGEYVNQGNPEGGQLQEGQHMGGQHAHMGPSDPHVPTQTQVMQQEPHGSAPSRFGDYHVGQMGMHAMMGPMEYPTMPPGIHGMSYALVSFPGHVTARMPHMTSSPGNSPASQLLRGASGSAQQLGLLESMPGHQQIMPAQQQITQGQQQVMPAQQQGQGWGQDEGVGIQSQPLQHAPQFGGADPFRGHPAGVHSIDEAQVESWLDVLQAPCGNP